MEAASPEPDPGTEEGVISKALADAVVKLVGFLATGTGFLTLLGVTGAGVTWLKLKEAQLPATQVIGLIGIDHLVADGALVLAGWILLGTVAVTAVYAIDTQHRPVRTFLALAAFVLVESAVAVWFVPDKS